MDLHDEQLSTIEQLNERWAKCYAQSEQAILKNPEVYREILSLTDEVCFSIIDIDEYFNIASRLARRLGRMGAETIFFNYFHEQIDPRRYGNPRYLRAVCWDLSDQINALNKWRRTRRCLRLVLSSAAAKPRKPENRSVTKKPKNLEMTS